MTEGTRVAASGGDANGRRSGKQTYPEDRFDRVERTHRVGAHRVTARPRYGWQFVIAGLIGFAILTGIGIGLFSLFDSQGRLPASVTGEATPKASKSTTPPKIDPKATIAILNGTSTQNLAAGVDQTIAKEKWGSIVFAGSAASTDVKISAVFYRDDKDQPAAAGLAAKLGGLSTYKTEDYADYQATLIVLLGSDYAGPGIDAAKKITASGEQSGPASGTGTPTADPNSP
ncbi:LytR C-terminal domain-containing protein [Leucobacter sp. CSA2]|uniref:LytR C-terminal domain-containing protein n=1 Tax=Leucobacter edaphi TaxID=2796472 RepID=A0A934QC75_9MICO|nr:LytR C-terminal domain-containing protein [Leucobacter edaphi]MBK0420474.1 LytR C-terminal domain-containing protein [Leucobacter edaphi]